MKFLSLLKEAVREKESLQEIEADTWKILIGTIIPAIGLGWTIQSFLKIKDLKKQLSILKKIAGTEKYKSFISTHPKGHQIEKQVEDILKSQEKPGIGTDILTTKDRKLPKFSPNE